MLFSHGEGAIILKDTTIIFKITFLLSWIENDLLNQVIICLHSFQVKLHAPTAIMQMKNVNISQLGTSIDIEVSKTRQVNGFLSPEALI